MGATYSCDQDEPHAAQHRQPTRTHIPQNQSGIPLRTKRILLVGPTGVGKSTLINLILGLRGSQRAETRAGGSPCTSDFREYGPTPSTPLFLIDSRGIEREDAAEQRDHILQFITSRNTSTDTTRNVHMVWYIPGMRWESSDDEYLRSLGNLVHTTVVITKSDIRKDIDPGTAKSALELTKQAILAGAPHVQIFACAAPPRTSLQWVPSSCPEGHGKDNFIILAQKRIWVCTKIVHGSRCGEYGEAHDNPYGYQQLITHALYS